MSFAFHKATWKTTRLPSRNSGSIYKKPSNSSTSRQHSRNSVRSTVRRASFSAGRKNSR